MSNINHQQVAFHVTSGLPYIQADNDYMREWLDNLGDILKATEGLKLSSLALHRTTLAEETLSFANKIDEYQLQLGKLNYEIENGLPKVVTHFCQDVWTPNSCSDRCSLLGNYARSCFIFGKTGGLDDDPYFEGACLSLCDLSRHTDSDKIFRSDHTSIFIMRFIFQFLDHFYFSA